MLGVNANNPIGGAKRAAESALVSGVRGSRGRGGSGTYPRPAPRSWNAYDGPVLLDVTGASVEELSSTGAAFVDQLNEASGRLRLAPLLILAALALFFLTPLYVGIPAAAAAAPAVTWLWQRDDARKTVVAYYEPGTEPAWLMAIAKTLNGPDLPLRSWRINAAGSTETTHQWKVNAGATKVISRQRLSYGVKGPRVLDANVPVPTLTAGRKALHFLPDRLLVRDGKRFSDVALETIAVDFSPQRFIEEGTVPRDAQRVGTTWRFVNVNGTPDRRFNNNRQLPIMLYGRLTLFTSEGLNWIVDFSRPNFASELARLIQEAR